MPTLSGKLIAGIYKQAKAKIASQPAKHIFTHATSAKNLHNILRLGKLMPLEQLAKIDPKAAVNVEKALTSLTNRKTLSAEQAAQAMRNLKSIDKLFLTKDKYLPHYGDYVIAKQMHAPTRRSALNLVPDEYVTDKAIDVLSKDTSIYVPDDLLTLWQGKYPGINFLPKSEINIPAASRLSGMTHLPGKALSKTEDLSLAKAMRDMGLISPEAAAGAVAGVGTGELLSDDDTSLREKLLAALVGAGAGAGYKNLRGIGGFFGSKRLDPELLHSASPRDIKRIFGPQAILAGSKPMGISTGVSDTDILVPYSTDYFFRRAVQDMAKNPEFKPSKLNLRRPDKQVFTYKDLDKDIDVVLARGEKAFNFRDAFERASKSLTDEQRAEIIANKQALQDAYILSKYRYNRYKKQLADDLGLRPHYF